MFYRLEDKKPVLCASGQEWAEWYKPTAVSGERIVARDELDDGIFAVSTVFVGIDPGAVDSEPPMLFETMSFVNGKATGIAIRTATWDAAEDTHRKMVRQIRKAEEDE